MNNGVEIDYEMTLERKGKRSDGCHIRPIIINVCFRFSSTTSLPFVNA